MSELIGVFQEVWVLAVFVLLCGAGFVFFSWFDELSSTDPDYIDEIAQEDETQ